MGDVGLLLAVAGVLISAQSPAVPAQVLLLQFPHQPLVTVMGDAEALGWVLINLGRGACGLMPQA